MLKQGDIVLVPIPFTDLSAQKRRPVIVISTDQYNQQNADVVVVAMTSRPFQTHYGFTITNDQLTEGALNRPGQIRVHKIYTLSQTIIVKKFGRVSIQVLKRIGSLLQELTTPSP
ncbi:MAG: type II toxin-antitoxin system PemK/MazF family toxin [Chloroflexi bacterium]|nr:type II toxin-antitoxin system PemK/MazF family toxin [Chloroflexota bacterium]MBP7043124.1 type II toxin-antitoxin system PemK/MazF family toxin [Chloroflexota bacterium]